MNQSNLQRIRRVLKFYELKGQNRERVNTIYYKILKHKYNDRYNYV